MAVPPAAGVEGAGYVVGDPAAFGVLATVADADGVVPLDEGVEAADVLAAGTAPVPVVGVADADDEQAAIVAAMASPPTEATMIR